MSSFQTFSERGLKAGAVVGANRAGSLQKSRADQAGPAGGSKHKSGLKASVANLTNS